MKITDLRIGNFVTHPEDWLTEIQLGDFELIHIGVRSISEYSGFVINEEWMHKFGFYCSEGVCELNIEDNGYYNGFTLKWSAFNGLWLYPNEGSICLHHVKFIHQLQNLYFSLSEKELELNK